MASVAAKKSIESNDLATSPTGGDMAWSFTVVIFVPSSEGPSIVREAATKCSPG
jgi:hypothetical protein